MQEARVSIIEVLLAESVEQNLGLGNTLEEIDKICEECKKGNISLDSKTRKAIKR